jgi:putative aminopeptidase FrvX
MAASKDAQIQLLLDLTGIPTAAGREDRVIAWVERWVRRRKNLRLDRDRDGNLLLTRAGGPPSGGAAPVFLTAHLDHPAFVVRRLLDKRTVELEFRGGVHDDCFRDKEVEIFDATDTVCVGKIVALAKAKPFRVVTVELRRAVGKIAPGDVGRWRLQGRGSRPTIAKGMLYAPACDDLAGVAAALAVLEGMRRRKGFGHVGVLLTRAEEIGFVGAIGAARSGLIPRKARLLCLENSRSFRESPIGGGPILRVGDRTGVFSPKLTNLMSHILREHEQKTPGFRWQRRLMPGGTCEATVFAEFGYEATCACLPLGNYHNMTDTSLPDGRNPTGGIGPEFISVEDYRGLIEMLRVCIEKLDSSELSLRGALVRRFAENRHVLKA